MRDSCSFRQERTGCPPWSILRLGCNQLLAAHPRTIRGQLARSRARAENETKTSRPSRTFAAALLLGAFLLCAGSVSAKDIPAAGVSRAEVQAAIDRAAAGDRVRVPAGTATWTEHVRLSKAITLQGAGIGRTIITNTQGDGKGTPPMDAYLTFLIGAPAKGRVRLTGFEIRMSKTAQGIAVYGPLWGEFQVDHCKFVESRGRACRNAAVLRGLYYNCIFLDNRKNLDSYAFRDEDWSWQSPLTLGTVNCIVVEDCEFRYQHYDVTGATVFASHGRGARTAWRHNLIESEKPGLDARPLLDAHGNQKPVTSDNTGPHRGTRSVEFYNNTIRWGADPGSHLKPTQIRGGTFICFGNTYTGKDVAHGFEMREEDGDNRFNYIDPSTYPGYDMHWAWIWDNTFNGSSAAFISYNKPDTAPFVIEGKNAFRHAPRPDDPPVIPGRQASNPADSVYPYKPLVYPHPWRGSTPAPPPPSELRAQR
ncbi:MAG: hypothetical protein JXR37_26905 [Kiritimatiellae bacterium]|nr:hypothetical protein [Kiritimatiellia bacterium]